MDQIPFLVASPAAIAWFDQSDYQDSSRQHDVTAALRRTAAVTRIVCSRLDWVSIVSLDLRLLCGFMSVAMTTIRMMHVCQSPRKGAGLNAYIGSPRLVWVCFFAISDESLFSGPFIGIFGPSGSGFYYLYGRQFFAVHTGTIHVFAGVEDQDTISFVTATNIRDYALN